MMGNSGDEEDNGGRREESPFDTEMVKEGRQVTLMHVST